MKKLVLLGTAESVFNPPYDDPETEIWSTGTAFGKAHTDIKRINMGFEIHPAEVMVKIASEKAIDYNRFKADGSLQDKKDLHFKRYKPACPVMVQNPDDEYTKKIINNPVRFPLDEVLKYAGTKFFTSTFCYMLVYAAMMGYKDISFYKILLCSGGEYFLERPGIEYWIEKLTQRENLNVHWPEDCELFSGTVLYGYEQRPNIYKMRSFRKYMYSRLLNEFHFVEQCVAGYSRNAGGVLAYNTLAAQVASTGKLDDKANSEMIKNSQKIMKDQQMQLQEHKEMFQQIFGSLQISDYEEERGM